MGKKCKNCGWDGNQPDWKLCGRCGLDPDVASQQPAAKSEQPPQLQDEPILTLDKSYIDFGSLVPGATLSKTFNIRNAGGGALVGKITSAEPWIGIFPAAVNLKEPTEEILVTIDTSLVPLNFRGSGYIDIQTSGGNARIEVKVNTQLKRKSKKGWIIAGSIIGSIAAIILMVGVCPSSPPPVLNVNTSPIYFNNIKPGLGDADYQTLTIGNTGGEKLTGTLTTNANWLWLSPVQIEIDSGANQNVRIHASTSGLTSGSSYNCFVIIETNGGEKQIPVYLTVASSVIFEDDFSDPWSGWAVGSVTNGKAEYLDGEYRLLQKSGGYYRCGDNIEIGQFDDFALEVDAQWHGTLSSSNYYGIVFRKQDNDDRYAFYVSSEDGYYALEKVVKGTGSVLKDWTIASTYIKKGAAVNRLKVVCAGPQISLYVNNSLLTTVYDSSFSKGYIGLMVGKGESTSSWITVPDADALFDNLKISAP